MHGHSYSKPGTFRQVCFPLFPLTAAKSERYIGVHGGVNFTPQVIPQKRSFVPGPVRTGFIPRSKLQGQGQLRCSPHEQKPLQVLPVCPCCPSEFLSVCASRAVALPPCSGTAQRAGILFRFAKPQVCLIPSKRLACSYGQKSRHIHRMGRDGGAGVFILRDLFWVH